MNKQIILNNIFEEPESDRICFGLILGKVWARKWMKSEDLLDRDQHNIDIDSKIELLAIVQI